MATPARWIACIGPSATSALPPRAHAVNAATNQSCLCHDTCRFVFSHLPRLRGRSTHEVRREEALSCPPPKPSPASGRGRRSTMTDLRRVTRALISVSDKSGLTDFARALAGHNVELISTGGTAKALAAAGLKVIDVAELTGFPEMMDGRVKTLHPKVHGGLLAIRDNKEHQAAMQAHAIRPIDLLVVNLYPFEATATKNAAFDECIENIDVGGPAMIRAAAKNHADVAVVVEPEDYASVLAELLTHDGATTHALRKKLATKAFARSAAYDSAIAIWFAQQLADPAPAYRT